MLITSWKCGAPPSKHRETTGKTVGRPLAKLPEDHWQNGWKTVGKIAGKPLGNAPFLGHFCQSQ